VPRQGRFRDRSVTLSGVTSITKDGSAYIGPNAGSRFENRTCFDFIGQPVSAGGFESLQSNNGLTLNGSTTGTDPFNRVWQRTFDHYPVSTSISGLSDAPLSVDGGWILNTVATTNPSRPVLTPLTLLQDFVELPRMVFDAGKLLMKPKGLLTAKQAANQNLAVQFGWIPFVKDIAQLLDLQSAVLKRSKELQRLYSGKGLRRRVLRGEDTQSADYLLWYSCGYSNMWLSFAYTGMVKRKQWATIRWKPLTPPPMSHGDDAMNKLAKKLVLGLTPEGLAKGAWDVIPWTWLLGWFTNVGDYLLANSNTVPAIWSTACLMNQVEVTITPGALSPEFCTSSVRCNEAYKRTARRRFVGESATPGFSMPFVDMRRLSILGSLSVQRFER
jgi:hypothetical protein